MYLPHTSRAKVQTVVITANCPGQPMAIVYSTRCVKIRPTPRSMSVFCVLMGVGIQSLASSVFAEMVGTAYVKLRPTAHQTPRNLLSNATDVCWVILNAQTPNPDAALRR